MTGNDNERRTVVEGQIERVVFTSEDDGCTVVQFKIDGRTDPVTVVGSLLFPTPGEMLRLQGQWKTHPRYGQRAIAVVRTNPYRRAAEISGIGFSTADKIASQIGVDHDAPMRIEAGVLQRSCWRRPPGGQQSG